MYDQVVIGSGFGGSVAALRLSEKGYKVLLLERGKRWHTRDFPVTNMNLRKFLWLPQLGFTGPWKLTPTRRLVALGGSGLGGGSLLYANTAYIPDRNIYEFSACTAGQQDHVPELSEDVYLLCCISTVGCCGDEAIERQREWKRVPIRERRNSQVEVGVCLSGHPGSRLACLDASNSETDYLAIVTVFSGHQHFVCTLRGHGRLRLLDASHPGTHHCPLRHGPFRGAYRPGKIVGEHWRKLIICINRQDDADEENQSQQEPQGPGQLSGPSSSPVAFVDLRTIRPLDLETIFASVGKTHRVVVAEEGWRFAGAGAQVVDEIQSAIFDELDAPVLRVTGADVPMPHNKHLERAAKVSAEQIVAAARKVLYLD